MKRFFASLAVLTLAAAPALAQDASLPPASRKAPWDPEVVKQFATLPVQESGRIKPIDTLAGFKLLKLRGVRSCPTPYGETLTPDQWLLDVLFFPEQAASYPTFLVQNSDVIDALAIPSKKKRDRYSYNELKPGIQRLRELAIEYSKVEAKDRSGLQEQAVQLFHNVMEYEGLQHYLDFARDQYPLLGCAELKKVFTPQDSGLSAVLAKADELQLAFKGVEAPASKNALRVLLDKVEGDSRMAFALILFPNSDLSDPRWLSPSQLVEARFMDRLAMAPQIGMLALLEQLERDKTNPAAFKTTLGAFHQSVVNLADSRHEYKKVPLEVAFYKADFFYRALYSFGFGFILIAFSWLWPVSALKKGSLALTILGGVLLVAGITLRCIIRSRPPVSTLYETILFISAVAVIVALAMEWINRQGVALAVAPLLGAMGMFLANKYEFKESVTAGDTMPQLQAVLDTNFWLSTHVTSVTTGYSAGLLAAAIAHVWLLGKMFGFRSGDDKFYKTVARMTYGVLCFGLLFSTVGTILGGIWANYSWGRFWGWDPKENGALMICLWELIILHARMGGYVRDFGLCLLALLGSLVIAFSWWGVNLLGVGLHSYGFTSGVLQILVAFCVLEALIAFLACGWWLAQKQEMKGAAPPAPQPPTPSSGPAAA